MAYELMMLFTFLNGWKQIKGKIVLCDIWKLCEIQVSVFINKGYWTAAAIISLCIINGCFHSMLAELHRYGGDHMSHRTKAIYYPAIPALDLCYSLCDSETKSISNTGELVRKAKSWSPSQNLNFKPSNPSAYESLSSTGLRRGPCQRGLRRDEGFWAWQSCSNLSCLCSLPWV